MMNQVLRAVCERSYTIWNIVVVSSFLAYGCASSPDASTDVTAQVDVKTDFQTTDTTIAPGGGLTPLHPRQDWDVTDFALSFRWTSQISLDSTTNIVTSATSYQLQVDDDATFVSPEIDVLQGQPKAMYEGDEQMFAQWSHIAYTPQELLAAGTYFWRVRVVETEEWSVVTQFTVNDVHTLAPPLRVIGSETPLFTFDMFFGTGTEPLLSKIPEIYNGFPAAVRPFVGFAIQNETIGMNPQLDDGFDGTLTAFLKPLAAAGVPVLIKDGGPDKDFQQFTGLAELEHIFQTQPNVIGLVEGETFWDFIDGVDQPVIYKNQVQWYKKTFQLAAKYGRVVIFGNGNDESFVWDQFLAKEQGDAPWMSPDEIRSFAPYLIFAPKNNIPFGYYQAEAAVMGAWLADMNQNWGLWSEGWAWGSIGYDSVFGAQLKGNAEDPDFSSMPYNLWIQMKLAGLSQGATVFHFGGESSVVEWGEYNPQNGHFEIDEDEIIEQSTAFWDMSGNEHPALSRYIFPFLEAIVSQKLIPTKAEVLDKVQLAVAAPAPGTEKGSGLDYGVYAPLIRNTVGVDGYVSIAEVEAQDPDADYYDMIPNACRRELLHNEGRYYMAPILPYPVNTLSDGTTVLSLSDLSDAASVKSQFNASYPESSTGDAWVVTVANRIYITNSHENMDQAQDFSVEMPGVGTLSGTIQPHAYLLVHYGPDSVWMMANAGGKGSYTDDRMTRVSLSLVSEPSMTLVRGEAISTWETGLLSLELSHQGGAAELSLGL